MDPTTHISTTTPLSPAEDYALLRAEGIRILQALSGHRWTDYNTHDPGLTILEQLCYALTDLGYRLGHPLPDLLTGPDGAHYLPEGFRARQILSSQPVTLDDFRRVLLDIGGVRNAWVEMDTEAWPKISVPDAPHWFKLPLPEQEGNKAKIMRLFQPEDSEQEGFGAARSIAKGLLRIKIEPDTYLPFDFSALSQSTGKEGTFTVEQQQQRTLRTRVQEALLPTRGLGMDFSSIAILKAQPIKVNARVLIDDHSDPDQLLVQIYSRIDRYLSPRARFYTLPEMLAKGYGLEEIIQGPRLAKGYLDAGELQHFEKRQFIHTSELVELITNIPGVKMVQTINLESHNGEYFKLEYWAVAIRPECYAQLEIPSDAGKRIQLISGQDAIATPAFAAKWESQQQQLLTAQERAPQEIDHIPAPGRYRQPGLYQAIQQDFPQAYGLQAQSLSQSADSRRRAMVRQLRGYLLFFDQLLANGFAQLEGVHQLLSYGRQEERTLYRQVPDVPDIDILLPEPLAQAPEAFQETGRLQRLMNHMLARFGEKMPAPGLLQLISDEGQQQFWRAKQQLLRNYPAISYDRGSGLDVRDQKNQSGFGRRIALLLNLNAQEAEAFFLLEHILLRPLPIDRAQYDRTEGDWPPGYTPSYGFLYQSKAADPFSLQVSLLFAKAGRFADDNFWQFVQGLIRKEAPAHIQLQLYRLEPDHYKEVEAVYQQWRAAFAGYGKLLDRTLRDRSLHLWQLREARNRLMELLTKHGGPFGPTYPVLDLPAQAPITYVLEDGATRIKVIVPHSQPDVSYQLWDHQNGRFSGEPVEGNGETIILISDVYQEDEKPEAEKFHEVFDIRAVKTLEDGTELEGYLQNEVDAVIRILQTHLEVEVTDKQYKIPFAGASSVRILDPEPDVQYTLHFAPLQDHDFNYFRAESSVESYPRQEGEQLQRYPVANSERLWYTIHWEEAIDPSRAYTRQDDLSAKTTEDIDYLDIPIPAGRLTSDTIVKVEASFGANTPTGFLADRACIFVGPDPDIDARIEPGDDALPQLTIYKPQSGVQYMVKSPYQEAAAYQPGKALAPDQEGVADNPDTAFRVEVDMIPNTEMEGPLYFLNIDNLPNDLILCARKLNTGITVEWPIPIDE